MAKPLPNIGLGMALCQTQTVRSAINIRLHSHCPGLFRARCAFDPRNPAGTIFCTLGCGKVARAPAHRSCPLNARVTYQAFFSFGKSKFIFSSCNSKFFELLKSKFFDFFDFQNCENFELKSKFSWFPDFFGTWVRQSLPQAFFCFWGVRKHVSLTNLTIFNSTFSFFLANSKLWTRFFVVENPTRNCSSRNV